MINWILRDQSDYSEEQYDSIIATNEPFELQVQDPSGAKKTAVRERGGFFFHEKRLGRHGTASSFTGGLNAPESAALSTEISKGLRLRLASDKADAIKAVDVWPEIHRALGCGPCRQIHEAHARRALGRPSQGIIARR